MHSSLNMGIYLLCMDIHFSKSAQEYPGGKKMIRFIKWSFPGCLSDSRQLSIWQSFQFAQPQQFQPHHHNSTWGYFFVRDPLVDVFKSLGLPVMLITCSWVVCLELKRPRTQDHIPFFFPSSLATSILQAFSIGEFQEPHPRPQAFLSLHLHDSYIHCWSMVLIHLPRVFTFTP